MGAERFLTDAELGAILGLSPRTVRKRVKDGLFPHWGEGKDLRFSPENVADIKALYAHPAKETVPLQAPPFDIATAIEGIERLKRAKQTAAAR